MGELGSGTTRPGGKSREPNGMAKYRPNKEVTEVSFDAKPSMGIGQALLPLEQPMPVG